MSESDHDHTSFHDHERTFDRARASETLISTGMQTLVLHSVSDSDPEHVVSAPDPDSVALDGADLEQAQHSAAKRRANIPHQQPVQSRSFPYAPSYASDKSFDASE